jgi:hypothetical protein
MPLKKGFKKMNLNIEATLHNQFKSVTAAEGKNMTDVLLKFIQDYVAKNQAGTPRPRRS